MEDPAGHQYFYETSAVTLCALTGAVLFMTTAVTAILWRKDFSGGIYRFVVLFKAGPWLQPSEQ